MNWKDGHLPALVTAVAYISMRPEEVEDDGCDLPENPEKSAEAVHLRAAYELMKEGTPYVMDEDEFRALARGFIERAGEENWRGMEWYENMISAMSNGSDVEDDNYDKDQEEDKREERRARGGGEMSMYGTDWLLSDTRKREYEIWRKGVKERISALLEHEKARSHDADMNEPEEDEEE
jgi:hypothetical protein